MPTNAVVYPLPWLVQTSQVEWRQASFFPLRVGCVLLVYGTFGWQSVAANRSYF